MRGNDAGEKLAYDRAMSRACALVWLWGALLLGSGAACGQADVARWMAAYVPPQGPDTTAVAQTPDGFLWVGGARGLARFDGAQWREISVGPGTVSAVDDLLVDPAGQLWVASGNRLLRLRGDALDLVVTLASDDSGIRRLRWLQDTLHLATTIGVYRLNPPAQLQPLSGLKDGTAYDLAVPGDGHGVLAGGRFGLSVDTGSGWQRRFGGEQGDLVTSLERDGDGRLWLGGYTLRVIPETDEAGSAQGPARRVRRLAALSNGELWVGTHSDGIFIRARNGSWRRGDRRLRGEVVNAIFEDRERNVWVATSGSGLHRFSLTGMEEIQFEDGLPTRLLSSIAAGAADDLWLATYGRGLVHIDRGRALTPVATPCGDALGSLIWQAPDTLWVGGEAGLCRMQDGRIEQVSGPGAVVALALAADGSLWALDARVLWHLVDGSVSQRIDRRDRIHNPHVMAMQDDGQGGVWVASHEGLVQAGPAGWRLVDDHGQVDALWAGDAGQLWLVQKGELVLRGRDGRRYATPAFPGAWLLWRDGSGALWQIGRTGSARVSEQALRERLETGQLLADEGVVEPDRPQRGDGATGVDGVPGSAGLPRAQAESASALRTGPDSTHAPRMGAHPIDPAQPQSSGSAAIEVFGTADGHGDSYPTEVGTPQLATLPDGRMAFVMYGQVRIGSLASPAWQRPALQTEVSAVTAPGVAAAEPGHAFSPGQWPIRLGYTAAALRTPQALRFRYRLLPLDADWSPPTAERSQSFARLAPGKYRFEVRVDSDAAAPAPAHFDFTVLPLWHETWWARVLLGIVALSLGVLGAMLASRWRVRLLTLRQRELESLVTARTAQLQDANRQLAVQARTDALTGLLNRRAFLDAFGHQWHQTRSAGLPLSVLMIDVDHFKTYNDHHGHAAGDEALRRIATALRTSMHWPDGLVARYGGEEFVAMLPRAGLESALAMGETLRAAVEALAIAHLGGDQASITTISIGAAVSGAGDTSSAEGLLACADAALYDAKRAGRNRVLARDG